MNLHPKTGRPIQPQATFEVGDAVSICILGDSYPAVVVHATPKTVYATQVGFIREEQRPVGTGEEAVASILDPIAVDEAIAAGKDAAQKFVLRVSKTPDRGASFNDRERYTDDGGSFHRTAWVAPNGGSYRLVKGATKKTDPHV